MVRTGLYAVVGDKEYRVGKRGGDWVHIVSKDPDDVHRGFELYDPDEGIYVKKVLKKELQNVFYIVTYAIYKGEKLSVGNIQNGKIMLATGDTELANKVGLELTNDKYFYEKWVDLSEVELIEEREPYTFD